MHKYLVVGNLYDCNSDFFHEEFEAENPFEAFIKAIMRFDNDGEQSACQYSESHAYDAVVIDAAGRRYTAPYGAPFTSITLLTNTLNALETFDTARMALLRDLQGLLHSSAATATASLLATVTPLASLLEVAMTEREKIKAEWEFRKHGPPPLPPPPPVEMPVGREARVVDLDTNSSRELSDV